MTGAIARLKTVSKALDLSVVVLTATIQIFVLWFVVRPVSKKATLDESIAETNSNIRRTRVQLATLRETIAQANADVARRTSEGVTLEGQHRDLETLLATARAKERQIKLDLDARRLEVEKAETERQRAAAAAVSAKLAEGKWYRNVRLDLANELAKGFASRFDARIVGVIVAVTEGRTRDDGLVVLFDEVSKEVLRTPEFRALSVPDRARLNGALDLVRVDMTETRKMLASYRHELKAWTKAYDDIWTERGWPRDSKGEPLDVSAPSDDPDENALRITRYKWVSDEIDRRKITFPGVHLPMRIDDLFNRELDRAMDVFRRGTDQSRRDDGNLLKGDPSSTQAIRGLR